jgi:hypothetical protein
MADDGMQLFTEVVRPSGYKTRHIHFLQETSKERICECIQEIVKKGAAYRRSGMIAYSINIPPEVNGTAIEVEIENWRQSGLLSNEDHSAIGAIEQSQRHLDYLLGRLPRLQNGRLADPELNIYP